MAFQSILLLSFHLAATWAQPNNHSCLDPQSLGTINKDTCCSGSGEGQAKVGTVLYEYTCNSYANNYYGRSLDASNAYTCAELCTKDTSCHASSWKPNSGGLSGHCWLSSGDFTLTADKYNLWVILVNTERAGHVVSPDPKPPIEEGPTLEEAVADAKAEAEARCVIEKQLLGDQYASAKQAAQT